MEEPSPESNPYLDRLKTLVPGSVVDLLSGQRDSAPRIVDELPRGLGKDDQEAWQVAGLYLVGHRRFHEAIVVFEGWYQNLLEQQIQSGQRVHKGTPLVWIRDCHVNQDHTALAKRFMMLTLIEDAIVGKGTIDPDKTGSYFRMVWYHGMSDRQFRQYAQEITAFEERDPVAARYPERVLQELDTLWMTEFPTTSEALLYPTNRRYASDLLAQTGDKTGRALELLAEYLLSVMPGCRTYRRKRSHSTDYDIVCSLDGFDLDFRSELGRYFVCECKDWSEPADFTTFAKFARVLDSTKSRFGILFSREGITGRASTSAASREQLKLFQDRGIVVVVVNRADIDAVINGYNFMQLDGHGGEDPPASSTCCPSLTA